jgi:hypothetical protein
VSAIPAFTSLRESREFFASNPHLNPTKSPDESAHVNGSYVKSERKRDISSPVPPRPHRITDVFLQEQFDSEGDTVWVIWGRGLNGSTYSIREIEHALSTVLTADEQHEAALRRASLRSLIVRLAADEAIPDEHDARPALQVVTEAAVAAAVDEQPEQLALDTEAKPGWKPPKDHPWRKPKRTEVAA